MPLRDGKGTGMSSDPVKRTFDQAAGNYDTIKIQIIPKYGEVERLVQTYVVFPKNRRVRVLELGTGTGKWAAGVLRRFPKAQYHGIDFSERMLQVASNRLERFTDRIILEELDLNKEMPGGRYDLIHSAFTIHHVRNKRALFKRLRNLLEPDGMFIYADITIANSAALEAIFLENWKAFMRQSPWPNRKIRTIINDHLENDIPETVETQLAHLKAAGFKAYDLLWRHEKFAAFHACK
jgi:tRNA (cmo5U34)-methyltransferase